MNQKRASGGKDVCCPFCGAPRSFVRYRYGDSAILACPACDLMWLHPRPARDQLYEIYGTMKYFTNSDFFDEGESHIYGYVDYMAERANKQYRYRKIVQDIKSRLIEDRGGRPSPMSWLDVGCGLGFLLDVAFDEGFRVGGVEFNRAAVDYIRAKYTFPVLYGPLDEVPIQGTYDVVSLFDVVEHLTDPVKDLTKLRDVIAPGGYLLLQTMDSRSPASRLLGKRLEDFRRTREHLYFFSRKSLAAVLDRSGWAVQETKFIGQTFQLGALIDRFAVYSKGLSTIARRMVFPRWLLEANFYVNPGTKMLVVAKAR